MNQRKLLVPIVTIVVIIILGFSGGNFLIQKIGQLRSDLEAARQEESKLKEKLTILTDFQSAGSVAEVVAASIPADNPAVDAISQVRLKSGNFGVASLGISVSKPVTDAALSHTDISYELQGDLLSTISFIEEIVKTSPFNKIKKFSLGSASGGAAYSLNQRIYFGALPLSLGRASDPLAAMSDDDIKIVTDLGNLEKPVFTALTPQPSRTNDNPFGI